MTEPTQPERDLVEELQEGSTWSHQKDSVLMRRAADELASLRAVLDRIRVEKIDGEWRAAFYLAPDGAEESRFTWLGLSEWIQQRKDAAVGIADLTAKCERLSDISAMFDRAMTDKGCIEAQLDKAVTALEPLEELVTTWLERGVKEGPQKQEPEDKSPQDPAKLAWAMGHFRCAQELKKAMRALAEIREEGPDDAATQD